jgi:hypothetical protein
VACSGTGAYKERNSIDLQYRIAKFAPFRLLLIAAPKFDRGHQEASGGCQFQTWISAVPRPDQPGPNTQEDELRLQSEVVIVFSCVCQCPLLVLKRSKSTPNGTLGVRVLFLCATGMVAQHQPNQQISQLYRNLVYFARAHCYPTSQLMNGAYITWKTRFGGTWIKSPVRLVDASSRERVRQFPSFPEGFYLNGKLNSIATDSYSRWTDALHAFSQCFY